MLSPGNPSWKKDFLDEAYATIILAHQTVTSSVFVLIFQEQKYKNCVNLVSFCGYRSGLFDEPQVNRFLHPSMVEYLREKRERLLGCYSASHLMTWMKHRWSGDGLGEELSIVAMRAAPFDEGGTLVQIAVRFRSLQSLEIRDERGLLVFGSHSKPELMMEVSYS